MRLYCPVPLISRELTRDMDIDGHKVLAGTTVNIPIWALHHNPTVWGEDHMVSVDNMHENDTVLCTKYYIGMGPSINYIRNFS